MAHRQPMIRTLASIENPLFSQASVPTAAWASRKPRRLNHRVTRRLSAEPKRCRKETTPSRGRAALGVAVSLGRPAAARSSNRLLAALALLGVTVWLWRTRRETWVWLVTGLPTAFMYAMSTWALFSMTLPRFRADGGWVIPADPVPWVGVVLLALAAVMLVEAIRALVGPAPPPSRRPKSAIRGVATPATAS